MLSEDDESEAPRESASFPRGGRKGFSELIAVMDGELWHGGSYSCSTIL